MPRKSTESFYIPRSIKLDHQLQRYTYDGNKSSLSANFRMWPTPDSPGFNDAGFDGWHEVADDVRDYLTDLVIARHPGCEEVTYHDYPQSDIGDQRNGVLLYM
jgi:hypothetical protein